MASSQLRILRIVQSTYPEVVGGIGLHVHWMSQRQAELGHEVVVLTTDNGDRSLPRTESRDGYTVVRHRELARPFGNSIAPGVVRSVLARLGWADVVHVHSHLYFMSNLSAIIGATTSTPVVLTNHGLISQTAPLSIQELFLPTIGRLTFEAVDRILCYTAVDRDRLLDRGIQSEIEIVPNGIDLDRFSPDRSSPDPRILFVGRLKPGKGVADLIRAFAQVADAFPFWTLDIVGDGPLRAELGRLATDCGIRDRVQFSGEVPNDQLPDRYRESALFVLPSRNEGFPRTLLEAMATGTPVVTTDLPQLEPVVDAVGQTVPPEAPGALADALTALMGDPRARREFGIAGRDLVKTRYSWTETVDQTIAVYEDLRGGATPQQKPTPVPSATTGR